MRLVRLILTLTVVGVVMFWLSTTWFPTTPEWLQVHVGVLTWVSLFVGLATTFSFQILSKLEKLREVKLSPSNMSNFRSKLDKRRARLWAKWWIAISFALVGLVSGQLLRSFDWPLFVGLGYTALTLLFILVVILVIEFTSMSNLLTSITSRIEKDESLTELKRRLHHKAAG